MLKFFFILFYINFFTIGGGYVMIPLLEKELVEKLHWLSHQEFIEAIAVGQVTPGPLTIMNAFIGYKLFGIAGAIGATISSYLPSLIVITLITYYYQAFRKAPFVDAVFKGIKPAVVGLLMTTAISLGRVSTTDFYTGLIAIVSFILIAFTKIDPTFIILGAGIAGILIY